jgi:hypothetical protein
LFKNKALGRAEAEESPSLFFLNNFLVQEEAENNSLKGLYSQVREYLAKMVWRLFLTPRAVLLAAGGSHYVAVGQKWSLRQGFLE